MTYKHYPVRLYFKHPPNIIMVGVGFLLNIVVFGTLLFQIRPQDELIFLHYNILFGVDLIGEWWQVLYLPIGGLLILLLNTTIGWILFQKDKFANYVLLITTVLAQVFLLIGATLLVFLNV